jgi:hypothetical protein
LTEVSGAQPVVEGVFDGGGTIHVRGEGGVGRLVLTTECVSRPSSEAQALEVTGVEGEEVRGVRREVLMTASEGCPLRECGV